MRDVLMFGTKNRQKTKPKADALSGVMTPDNEKKHNGRNMKISPTQECKK